MGNHKARELMKLKEQDALWQRIQNEPRPATRDVFAQGIGQLRIQLIECPSFDDAQAWDVRDGEQGWRLFRSRVLETTAEVQLIGYERVEFPPEQLTSFFIASTRCQSLLLLI